MARTANDLSGRLAAGSRAVERLVRGTATSDGAGVRLTRVLTHDLQRRLDPFLMLDAFRSDDPEDYIAGFPDHPHRGFETVTYMIEGRMRHRDSAGHEGLLGPGGMQWMIAGSGLIHSELPEQEAGRMEGFQLWLNLPAAGKMVAPGYRDFAAADIPGFETGEGVRVRVLAGESRGVRGAMTRPVTEPLYLDVHLPAGTHYAQALPGGHNAFTCTYRGSVTIRGTEVPDRHMAILANDGAGSVLLEAGREVGARVLIVAGRPLGEPIAQYGPFVMNTAEEIHRTLAEYRSGAFEAARIAPLPAPR